MDTQVIKSIRLEAEINNFEVPIFPTSLSKKEKKLLINQWNYFLGQRTFEGTLKSLMPSLQKHKQMWIFY